MKSFRTIAVVIAGLMVLGVLSAGLLLERIDPVPVVRQAHADRLGDRSRVGAVAGTHRG